MRRFDSWRSVARALKKALIETSTGSKGFYKTLSGHHLYVTYEGRRWREGRDYQLLSHLAIDKRCIFDVGANIGIASLIMGKSILSEGQIYAFEASEEACRIAQENFRLNGLAKRIQIVNALVLSPSKQVQDFFWSGASGGASTISGYMGHNHAIKKAGLSLDQFAQQQNVRPDMIKVDVEGAEGDVISGMRWLFQETKPLVVVELHSWEAMTVAGNAAAILSVLKQVNYKMVYLRSQLEVTDVAVMADRGRCHVLLLPQEAPLPECLHNFDTSSL
ncbi:MAG: FkbM family methyltransferase [Anaerolineae bacterium]|nr:FkbM family methyltransferase [Anaerolineae bacterium]